MLPGCGLLLMMLAACGAGDGGEAGATAGEGAGEVAAPSGIPADPAHSSRNALDWAGTYDGVLPCADCEGIETRVTLADDGTFTRTSTYLGRQAAPFEDAGRFTWDEAGRIVTLEAEDGATQSYQVGENVLFHLDRAGERITGDLAAMYELDKRAQDPRIEGHRWVLIEIMGEPFEAGGRVREAFLILDPAPGRAGGNTSCNSFSGEYRLGAGQRITFGERMASTKMACPPESVETQFFEVLQRADSYSIDGDVLSLNRARMAPLARFRRDAGAEAP
jgi:uncharacterized lipoprotein NlpE involved in copper resistance